MSVLHCLWNGGIGGAERAVYQLVSKQIDSAEIAPGLLFGRAEGPYYERALRLDCPVVALHATSGTDVRTCGARHARWERSTYITSTAPNRS